MTLLFKDREQSGETEAQPPSPPSKGPPTPALPQFPRVLPPPTLARSAPCKGTPGPFKPPPPGGGSAPFSDTAAAGASRNREPRGAGRLRPGPGAGRPPPLRPPHGSARGAGSRPPPSAPPAPRGRPALNRHRCRRDRRKVAPGLLLCHAKALREEEEEEEEEGEEIRKGEGEKKEKKRTRKSLDWSQGGVLGHDGGDPVLLRTPVPSWETPHHHHPALELETPEQGTNTGNSIAPWGHPDPRPLPHHQGAGKA